MGCQSTRCRGEGCTSSLPNCQLINGLCPSCYSKSLEATKPKKDASPKTK